MQTVDSNPLHNALQDLGTQGVGDGEDAGQQTARDESVEDWREVNIDASTGGNKVGVVG